MSTESNGGAQVCTVTTEHTLATITTAGTYVLWVDLTPSVSGTTPDIFEVRAKVKIRSGEASKQVYRAAYIGAQGAEDVIKVSVPIDCAFELVFTLKQTQGTSRTITWSVHKL